MARTAHGPLSVRASGTLQTSVKNEIRVPYGESPQSLQISKSLHCLLMVEIPLIEEKVFKFTFRDANKIQVAVS